MVEFMYSVLTGVLCSLLIISGRIDDSSSHQLGFLPSFCIMMTLSSFVINKYIVKLITALRTDKYIIHFTF